MPEAVVIGAGPGGLAAAAMLQRAGVQTVVVDRAPAIANSWRGHYDRLHLHTVRWLSHLPGYKLPRRYDFRVTFRALLQSELDRRRACRRSSR